MTIVNRQTKRIDHFFSQVCVGLAVFVLGMPSVHAMDHLHPQVAKLREKFVATKFAEPLALHTVSPKWGNKVSLPNADVQNNILSTFVTMATHPQLVGFVELARHAMNHTLAERGTARIEIRQQVYDAIGRRFDKKINDGVLRGHAICVQNLCSGLKWTKATAAGLDVDEEPGFWGSVAFSNVAFGLYTPERGPFQGVTEPVKWFETRFGFQLDPEQVREILWKIPLQEVDPLLEAYSTELNEEQGSAIAAKEAKKVHAESLDGVFASLTGGDDS